MSTPNMDLLSQFCNICYNRQSNDLTDICGNNRGYLLYKLLILTGSSDFTNSKVYLCPSCREKLANYFEFRHMCIQNLVQFRRYYCSFKATLEKDQDCNIEKKLRALIEEHVYKLERDQVELYCDESEENLEDTESTEVITIVSDDECNENEQDDPGKTKINILIDRECDNNMQVTEISTNNDVDDSKNLQSDNDKGDCITDFILDYRDSENFEKLLGADKSIQVKFLNLEDSLEEASLQTEESATITDVEKYTSEQELNKNETGVENAPKFEPILMHRFMCQACNETFPNRLGLGQHVCSQGGPDSYRCFVCEKTFDNLHQLSAHRVEPSSGSPFKCCKCEKTFIYHANLTLHQRVHTGIGCHICQFCKKKFTRPSHLQEHERKHTGDKPFECHVCKKRYNRAYTLSEHLKIHTASKPYPCSMCNAKFRTQFTKRRHELTHKKVDESTVQVHNGNNQVPPT